MDDAYVLVHHGIKGQKWGVRRFQNKDGSLTALGRKKYKSQEKSDDSNPTRAKISSSTSSKKPVEEMTDEEIRSRISRLELEKKYKDLSTPKEQKKCFDGKKFVTNILEKSGENILTQATTYVFGTVLNKAVGKEIVNPKKGQKDK